PPGAVPDPNPKARTIGVVLYPGYSVFDVFGPLEYINWLSAYHPIKLVTISHTLGPTGGHSIADATFETAPPVNIVLVPGSINPWPHKDDTKMIDFIKKAGGEAENVLVVCTGGWAGLLDGKKTTTNKAQFDKVAAEGSRTEWVRRARWVVDGHMFTSSGVSAGQDMTHDWIAKTYSPELARMLANQIERTPHEDASWDPFATVWGTDGSEPKPLSEVLA
ncbi:class I glutamine amidotransferase-like protein, partial [Blyttiomyces helicus]